MKKIKVTSFLTVLLLSVSTSAEELPIQMSGGMIFSAFDDHMRDTEALGYRASVGYHINDNVLFELGYADFSAFSDSEIDDRLRAVMVETDLLAPVSDYAAFYAGIGGALSNDGTNLTASIGLKYQFSQNWYADVGYQGVFDLVHKEHDLYAFNALLVYRFSTDEQKKDLSDISQRPNLDKLTKKQPQILAPEPKSPIAIPVKKEPLCQENLIEYRVVYGDYLLLIARKFNTSLDDLVKINGSLNDRNLDLIYPGEKIIYRKFICLD